MLDDHDFIDVRKLLTSYDMAHHKEAANRYFDTISSDHDVMRKPFSDFLEAAYLLPGIAAVIHGLNLYKGARVLDFGCGGGWLTRIFAYLGCDAVGIDFAGSAARVAQEATNADRISAKLNTIFLEYDGHEIPWETESFDGATVFDAFHHIPNQPEIMAELFRVLKPGCSVAFHEPGPNHSRLPQSQMEMRDFGVIERDFVISEIRDMAVSVGFGEPQMAIISPWPLWTSLPVFDRLIDGDDKAVNLAEHIRQPYENLRIFKLTKPGTTIRDSRSPVGLDVEFSQMKVARKNSTVKVALRIKNTGSSYWLPSGNSVGSVNLGVQKEGDRDFHRVHFTSERMAPGQSIDFEFSVRCPDTEPLHIDLVAEGVVWFSMRSGTRTQI